MQISSLSLQYIKVPVTAVVNGASTNPTADTVVMAFVAPSVNPAPADWQIASWETATAPTTTYYARCLIGPGGTIALPAAHYYVWVKITDSPEVPAIVAGTLTVT